jgi:hypothetical protein
VSRSIAIMSLSIAICGGGAFGAPVPPTDKPASGATPARAAAQGLAADESFTVVVHTAEDCPICKVWRESPGGLATAKQLPRDWPQLKVVFIERKSLYGSESESLYPPELQYLYQDRRARYQLSPPVPMFEIVRHGKVISRHAGLQGWTDGTLSEIRLLETDSGSSMPRSTQDAAPR